MVKPNGLLSRSISRNMLAVELVIHDDLPECCGEAMAALGVRELAKKNGRGA